MKKAHKKLHYLFLTWPRLLILLAALSHSPFSHSSEENSGAGLVLLHSIMRSKTKDENKVHLLCLDHFKNESEQGQQTYDLYNIALLEERQHKIFTKINSENACSPDRVENIVGRHPCLDGALQDAILKAHDLKNDLARSYDSLSRNGLYEGDIPLDSFRYSLIIQSTDPKLQHIDMRAWDFSWLSSWNPWLTTQNTCPFQFKLRLETNENHRLTTIQQFAME